MAIKTEKESYHDKFKFYQEKKDLIKNRIKLLQEKVVENNVDELTINAYRMEILDLDASLEGVESYYAHYYDRIQSIEKREAEIAKECEENFKHYYNILISISPATLKQHSGHIQEQYNKIVSVFDKEWEGAEKTALYSLMKSILQQMKKI